MTNNSSSTSGGIGFGGALFLVFLVLKLTDKIQWSWWWVTAPFWMPLAFVCVVLVIAGIGWLIRDALKDRSRD